jgi:hypothetical protein
MMLALQSLVTPDRRSDDRRYRPVLLIGRVDGANAPVCLVHDISAQGLMARFPDPPAVGDELTVEVRGLPPIRGTVRWVDGPKAGLRFAERQDVTRLFAIQREDGTIARPPAFRLPRRPSSDWGTGDWRPSWSTCRRAEPSWRWPTPSSPARRARCTCPARTLRCLVHCAGPATTGRASASQHH